MILSSPLTVREQYYAPPYQHAAANPTSNVLHRSSICHRCTAPRWEAGASPGSPRDPSGIGLEWKLKTEWRHASPAERDAMRFRRVRAVHCCMNSACPGGDFASHDETGPFGVLLVGLSEWLELGLVPWRDRSRPKRLVPPAYATSAGQASNAFRQL